MFIVALFMIVNHGTQSKCPSVVEWGNKLVHPYTGIVLYNIKEQTSDTVNNMGVSLKYLMK